MAILHYYTTLYCTVPHPIPYNSIRPSLTYQIRDSDEFLLISGVKALKTSELKKACHDRYT
jgi:hypothetical protein